MLSTLQPGNGLPFCYTAPMVYRVIGGIFLVLLGLSMCGVHVLTDLVIGILGVIAGIALLAGL